MKMSADTTHPCRSSKPTVNCCDLTPKTRTQTSEQEYNNVTASSRRPSTLFSRNTPQYFSWVTYAFFEVNKTCADIFGILPRFLKNFLECVQIWSIVVHPWQKPHWVVSIPQLWFDYLAASFLKAFDIYFSRESNERDVPLLVHYLLYPFLCMGVINPTCQSFATPPVCPVRCGSNWVQQVLEILSPSAKDVLIAE